METENKGFEKLNKNKNAAVLITAVLIIFIFVGFNVVGGGKDASLITTAKNLFQTRAQRHATAVMAKVQKIKQEVEKEKAKIDEEKAKQEENMQASRAAVSESGGVGREYGNPPPTATCALLTQQDFDNAGGNITLDFTNGCYEIRTDIQFDYTLVVKGGGANTYFTCNNHTLRNKTQLGNQAGTGINAYGSNLVKNCVVENRYTNFYVKNNGRVIDSTARNAKVNGFFVGDFGNVSNSFADNDVNWGQYGFYVQDYGLVSSSTAKRQDYGFTTFGNNASTSNSLADGNVNGFWVQGGRVTNSTARNNYKGFIVENSTTDHDTAESNVYGFWFDDYVGHGELSNNTAISNQHGFVIVRGNNFSNTARNNTVDGFYVDGGNVRDSFAVANSVGFVVTNNGSVTQSSASQQNSGYGFILNGGTGSHLTGSNNKDGAFVGTGAILSDGDAFCNVTEYGIFGSGGTINGTFRSNKQIQGAWNGNATIIPCGGGGGGGGSGSPIMKKPYDPF